MNLKRKLYAAAATLTLVGGVSAVGAMSASAATPSCGASCFDLFSKNFGSAATPQYIGDVWRGSQKVGQPFILFRVSNSDAAEDFSISDDGQVSDLFAAGLVSSSLALHYGCINGFIAGTTAHCTAGAVDDYAFEDQYAPDGVDSGLCVGVGATAFSGEKVSLQPCGVSSKTWWVADTLDSCPSNPLYSAEIPVINGSDTNFSHPFVLTYPASGDPVDKPRPQFTVTNLTGFTQTGGTGGSATCGGSAVVGPDNNQLFSADEGIVP